jgi:hypothetical protein
MKKTPLALILGALPGAGFSGQAAGPKRDLSRPLSPHSGNVFVAGEPPTVTAPPGEGETCRAVDYDGSTASLRSASLSGATGLAAPDPNVLNQLCKY